MRQYAGFAAILVPSIAVTTRRLLLNPVGLAGVCVLVWRLVPAPDPMIGVAEPSRRIGTRSDGPRPDGD